MVVQAQKLAEAGLAPELELPGTQGFVSGMDFRGYIAPGLQGLVAPASAQEA